MYILRSELGFDSKIEILITTNSLSITNDKINSYNGTMIWKKAQQLSSDLDVNALIIGNT